MHHSINMIQANSRRWNRAAVVGLIGIASWLWPALSSAQTPPVYTVNTIIGQGPPMTGGYAGDGGPAITAQINGPTGLVFNSKGTLYIVDQFNNVVRAVSSGNISTVAGVNGSGSAFAGDGAAAISASFSSPDSVALDSSGNIYISDAQNNVVRQVTIGTGIINTYAGEYSLGAGNNGDGAAATAAQLSGPAGLAIDSSGNLYIADARNNKIRLVTASTGFISTFAGTGSAGFDGDGGQATAAHLNTPRQIVLDAHGTLYIADSESNEIRKITGGVITLVAGDKNGLAGFAGDGGLAIAAQLRHPTGVAVDAAGNVYICDTGNNRIRMVTPDGIIHTIAGYTIIPGYTGDGGPALSAQFAEPTAIIVDAAGNLYVADLVNNVIRELTPGSAPGGPAPLPAIRATGSPGVQTAYDFGGFTTVSPGSWIEIYGTNLAADTRGWANVDFNGIYAPTSLDRTVVTIGGQNAFIDYISPTQVNAQVPGSIGLGAQPVTVSTASGTSAAYTVNVSLEQPGLYAPAAFKILGKQYVGAMFGDYKTFVFPPNSFSGITSRQAKPGDLIVIYGIGFGPVPGNPPGQIPQAANGLTLPLAPKFYFGGTPAMVQYAAMVAPDIGLYSFNVIVPNIANSDAVPLTFTVNIDGTDVPGAQTLYTAVHQ